MHHHAFLLLTVQASVSVYSILFQAALTSPFKMILLLHRTNLQLSENNVSLLLTLAHRFQYISYLKISISHFFQMSTRFLNSGDGGIRTLVPVNAKRFRVVLVMTTSIRLRMCLFQKSTSIFVTFFQAFVNAFVKKNSAIRFSCILPVLNRSSKSARSSMSSMSRSLVKCRS